MSYSSRQPLRRFFFTPCIETKAVTRMQNDLPVLNLIKIRFLILNGHIYQKCCFTIPYFSFKQPQKIRANILHKFQPRCGHSNCHSFEGNPAFFFGFFQDFFSSVFSKFTMMLLLWISFYLSCWGWSLDLQNLWISSFLNLGKFSTIMCSNVVSVCCHSSILQIKYMTDLITVSSPFLIYYISYISICVCYTMDNSF